MYLDKAYTIMYTSCISGTKWSRMENEQKRDAYHIKLFSVDKGTLDIG